MSTSNCAYQLLLIFVVCSFLTGCKDNDPYISNANPQVIGWTSIASGTTQTLTSASYASSSVIYVAGSGGTVLRSIDGGANWSLLQIPTKENLSCIHFSNANTGVVMGDNGAVLYTTDAGVSWTQTFPKAYYFYALSFSDPLNGVAVGSKGPNQSDSGIVVRTTNGGLSWTDQSSSVNSWNRLSAVSSIDAIHNVVGGYIGPYQRYPPIGGALYMTNDKGATWKTDTATSDGFWCSSLYFTDNQYGTMVGQNGRIYRTVDSASSWQLIGSSVGYVLRHVCFSDRQHGTIVGDMGVIFHTVNGGATWQLQSDGGVTFYASAWSDNLHGIIVGAGGIILSSVVQ